MATYDLLYLSFSHSFLAGRSNSHNVSKKRRSISKQITFDSTKFKLKYVLGSGSFGVVTYAEYLDENCDINNGSYALKSISKADVVETGKCEINHACHVTVTLHINYCLFAIIPYLLDTLLFSVFSPSISSPNKY